MVSSFDSIKNCIPLVQSTERHLWITDKQGKVQWINRKSYSCLRQNGRLQVAFGNIKNLVDGLPKIDTAAAENIQFLSNLKKQISNKYLNFSKAHSTPLFGYLYRLLFARSLDSNYKAALLSIDTYLKNHISKLSVDEFKTFISFFKPEEAVSYLSLLDEEALNRLTPLLPDELLIKLDSSQIAKLQLDKFTSKQICLIKDKLTIQQLNKLDLSQWSYDDVVNLYTSKNVAEASSTCIKTINPIGWPFDKLRLFLIEGLQTYSKNVRTGNWPLELNKRLREDDLLSEWASIYASTTNLLNLPVELLATITEFNPNAIHRLAVVSKTSLTVFQSSLWVNRYFRQLKDGIGEDNFNYLRERFSVPIQLSTKQCIDTLAQNLYHELKNSERDNSFKGIQLADIFNHLEDRGLAQIATTIFSIKEICEEIGDRAGRIKEKIHAVFCEQDFKTGVKLVAQLTREEIAKISSETLLKVTDLNLSGHSGLGCIAKEVFLFQNLKFLKLDSNNLTTIPLKIKTLKNLESVKMKSNHIGKLPKELFQLSNLRELDISLNRLSAMPIEISSLPNLVSLDFSYPQRITKKDTEACFLRETISVSFKASASNQINAFIKDISDELAKHKSSESALLDFLHSSDFSKIVDQKRKKHGIGTFTSNPTNETFFIETTPKYITPARFRSSRRKPE